MARVPGHDRHELEALIALIADEVNVKAVEVLGDDSGLVEHRVKVLLPKVGKRLGAAIPAVMAAARDGAARVLPDGTVEIAGIVLAADEVEILATPRPGTVVAADDGLVVVLDTELTPELRAEGDARELQRAIQDLRKEAGLELDDRIELHVEGIPVAVARYLGAVAVDTLATLVAVEPAGAISATAMLDSGPVRLTLRREGSGVAGA